MSASATSYNEPIDSLIARHRFARSAARSTSPVAKYAHAVVLSRMASRSGSPTSSAIAEKRLGRGDHLPDVACEHITLQPERLGFDDEMRGTHPLESFDGVVEKLSGRLVRASSRMQATQIARGDGDTDLITFAPPRPEGFFVQSLGLEQVTLV